MRILSCAALVVGALVAVPVAATAAPDDGAPFTVVVLPDLQGYSVDAALAPGAVEQTRWIARQAASSDVAVVAQVGDLVESHPVPAEWERASAALKVLDDAGVPSAVLPGNHDMDVATGATPLYDQYFPASRYTGASWNGSKATRVAGFQGNQNSATTFRRSGMDFLLLSLEYDPTDDVLAWAKDVLAAYPDHRVILSTHSFVHTAGGRSGTTTRTDAGANTPAQVWSTLVQPSCQIFLVVNGHWHDGPDRTEARRTDTNACGKPVHQVLSNYQDRPNGGDGWLRTYTFDPAADTITARTYSPTLDRDETDADSAFTLPYDMDTTAPAGGSPVTLVPDRSPWAYRFDNTTLPATWKDPGFDASTWRTGNAVLGFGSTVTTNIDVPAPTSNRPRSAQLRRTFTVDDPTRLSDITLTTRADDGLVLYLNGTEITRRNLPTGTLTRDTYATAAPRTSAALAAPVTLTIPASALRSGTNTLAASVHVNYRATPDLTFDATLTARSSTPPPAPTPVTLVPDRSPWAYRFDNTTLPATWKDPGFDASTWRTGNAVLGFGSTVTTNIDVPAPTSNRPRSAQLRRTFTVDDPSRLSDITLTTRADDGLVLYLNGTEITRRNLPTGTLTRDTYATAAPRTSAALAAPVTLTIPASALRSGTNTLAASVHVNYRATPDLTFDATLTAKRSG